MLTIWGGGRGRKKNWDVAEKGWQNVWEGSKEWVGGVKK